MLGLVQALGAVKSALAILVLTAVTAFAGTSAGTGVTGATPDLPSQAAGHPAASIVSILDANQARLLQRLKDTLAMLQANGNANDHAILALERHIAAIEAGQDGLSTAAGAVGGNPPAGNPPAGNPPPGNPPGARPPLPSQAVNPPNPPAHPSATDHPSATNHPGRP